MTEMYHMCGTLEVGLKAYLHPSYQHCTDEAQKAETVLSAVSYIYIYIFSKIQLVVYHQCCVLIG